jgi:hypothetical protein
LEPAANGGDGVENGSLTHRRIAGSQTELSRVLRRWTSKGLQVSYSRLMGTIRYCTLRLDAVELIINCQSLDIGTG